MHSCTHSSLTLDCIGERAVKSKQNYFQSIGKFNSLIYNEATLKTISNSPCSLLALSPLNGVREY